MSTVEQQYLGSMTPNTISNIKTPGIWKDVAEFAKWYADAGYPIRPPQRNAIFRTNNASALVLYREGQFQVELYIGDSNSVTHEHRHPGVESIIVYLSGEGNTTVNNEKVKDLSPYFNRTNPDGTSVLFKQSVPVHSKDTHGLTTYGKGFAFYSIEQWHDGVEPTSVTICWEGPTTGEIHDAVIADSINQTA